PRFFVVWGKDAHGRPVVVDLSTPQFILMLGRLGIGKTHAFRLIEEGIGAPVPGLSRFDPELGRIIRFSVNRGRAASDQLMAGFKVNPYLDQWDVLETHYGQPWCNKAFREGQMFCFKDRVAAYQRDYAEFVERGLEIYRLLLHTTEIDYCSILSGGS